MFFIGVCFEGTNINASDTLNNKNFNPHTAIGAILTWFENHGAAMASKLYRNWESKNQSKVKQLSLFNKLGEEEFGFCRKNGNTLRAAILIFRSMGHSDLIKIFATEPKNFWNHYL
jgi:hypothetical protein